MARQADTFSPTVVRENTSGCLSNRADDSEVWLVRSARKLNDAALRHAHSKEVGDTLYIFRLAAAVQWQYDTPNMFALRTDRQTTLFYTVQSHCPYEDTSGWSWTCNDPILVYNSYIFEQRMHSCCCREAIWINQPEKKIKWDLNLIDISDRKNIIHLKVNADQRLGVEASCLYCFQLKSPH